MDQDPRIWDTLLDLVHKKRNIFLLGPGGFGKSHTIRRLSSFLTEACWNVASTALTGIAAINNSVTDTEEPIYGTTLHRWSGIGSRFNMDRADIVRLAASNKDTRTNWMLTDILIIDEISMMGRDLLETVDAIGKKIRESNLPFGGLQVIFSGDFLQLPPVKDEWVFNSPLFERFDLAPILFSVPMRYTDENYVKLLLRMREGYTTVEDHRFLQSRVDAYSRYIATKDSNILAVQPTRLYSTRKDVGEFNICELKKLKTRTFKFVATDVVLMKKGATQRDQEYLLKSLEDLIPEEIELKVGAQVMLRTNNWIGDGYGNGSRGVIVDIVIEGSKGPVAEPSSPNWKLLKLVPIEDEVVLHVKMMDGNVKQFPRYNFMNGDKNGDVLRRQTPFILAWALTIHKSQGSTLDYAIVDCGGSVFEKGQAYVACSRVRSGDGLLLLDYVRSSIKTSQEALEYSIELEARAENDNPSEYTALEKE